MFHASGERPSSEQLTFWRPRLKFIAGELFFQANFDSGAQTQDVQLSVLPLKSFRGLG